MGTGTLPRGGNLECEDNLVQENKIDMIKTGGPFSFKLYVPSELELLAYTVVDYRARFDEGAKKRRERIKLYSQPFPFTV